jgi:hypothetical protein
MPGQNLTDTDPAITDDTPEPEGQTPPSLTLSPDAVRNSPEYRALAKQARDNARAAGRAEAEAARVRTEAAEALQAAEAQRQQAIADQIAEVLGDDGVDAFNDLAELSASDPVAAARKFQSLISQYAQSGGNVERLDAAVSGEANAGGTTVTEQAPPPVPSNRVDGDAPLNQPGPQGDDWEGISKDAAGRYAAVVERNQDPIMRSRVTDRERAGGFMAWIEASIASTMAKAPGRIRINR